MAHRIRATLRVSGSALQQSSRWIGVLDFLNLYIYHAVLAMHAVLAANPT